MEMIIRDSRRDFNEENFIRRVCSYVGLICYDITGKYTKFLLRSFLTGLILVGGTIPINIYGLLLELNSSNSKWMPSTTAVVVVFSHYGSFSLATLTSILMGGIKYKNMAKMYTYIDSFNNILPRRENNKKIKSIIAVSFIFCLIFFVMDFIICYRINKNYVWYTPVFVNEIVFFTLLVQMSMVAHRLQQMFLSLNNEIEKTLKKPIKEGFVSEEQIFETYKFSSFLSRKAGPKQLSLQHLCDIHWDLSKAIHQFNSVFGVQVVIHFFRIFLHLIDSPYFIYLALTDSDSSIDDVYYSIDITIWTLIHYAQLSAIVIPCGKATKMAQESSYTIARYLNIDESEETKDEARSFLFLVKQHTVAFCACGMFYLEESVITSVTAAVTTYLVILLQFQAQG